MRATKKLKRYRNLKGQELLSKQSSDLREGIIEKVSFYIPTKTFEAEFFLRKAEKLDRFYSTDLGNGYTILSSFMISKKMNKVTPNSYFQYKFHTIFQHAKFITIGDTLVYGTKIDHIIKNYIDNNLQKTDNIK